MSFAKVQGYIPFVLYIPDLRLRIAYLLLQVGGPFYVFRDIRLRIIKRNSKGGAGGMNYLV